MKTAGHEGDGERRKIRSRIGDALVWFCTGYTRAGVDEGVFWMDTYKYLAIDGEFADNKWIKAREAALLAESGEPFPDQKRKAYSRARLEDFCRHQGVMPDGRVVARLPIFGTDREQLAGLGILADNFERNTKPREDRDENFTVILPEGWSFDTFNTDPMLQNERWAGVFDASGKTVAHVLYEHWQNEAGASGFRSFTSVAAE